MKARPTMTARAEAYLRARRALGVGLRIEGQQLLSFARFADSQGPRAPLTLATALVWARASSHATRVGQARRLDVVRPFARWLLAHEPDTEVPATGLLGPSHRRRPPHLFSDTDIDDLVAAARHLSPVDGLRPKTFATLFGLLACTGLRPGEAVRLTRDDVDLQDGRLVVRETKFHKSRLVPLHPSATQALHRYARARDRHLPNPDTAAFFLLDTGLPVTMRKAETAFKRIRFRLGWTARPGRRAPRLYDLRHRFACAQLLRWHVERADVGVLLPRLATYLGHVKVSDTYWYLTGEPTLMAICSARFEQFMWRREEGLK
jgi:integrase/recombinase XerD